ncbi:RICIN domain-containing protein [Streptomyces albidocamelliae]|uniref:RICIN domain-containing protein n=1 Tax=Streptomyces albidocamelliae TaxID=2981135 RepID=UPI0029551981|nr:RICIN domain-containing protein [Streptomyces sp. HUAS 14-6]
MDVRGTPESGAAAVLAVCSTTAGQQWTYDADGQLRSAAATGLCLDSHADAGVVTLGSCAGAGSKRADDVRYDLTVRGELLPRWDRTVALATAGGEPGSDVVVKIRDRSAGQRWQSDSPTRSPGSLSIAGSDGPAARPAEDTGKDT